jgi:hypothetical protein
MCLFKVSTPVAFFRLAKYLIWLSPNDFDGPSRRWASAYSSKTLYRSLLFPPAFFASKE